MCEGKISKNSHSFKDDKAVTLSSFNDSLSESSATNLNFYALMEKKCWVCSHLTAHVIYFILLV